MPVGDELRAAFVSKGTYWGAVGIVRAAGEPPFTDEDVELLDFLSATEFGVR